MLAAFDRPLKHNNNKISLARDRRFVKCRQVREGKARAPREKGHGKRPKATKTLTVQDEDSEQLWKYRIFGEQNPESLLYAMWNLLTLYSDLRGCQEHHEMLVKDFSLNKDDQAQVRNIRGKPKEDLPRRYKKETKSDSASLPMKVPVFQSSS